MSSIVKEEFEIIAFRALPPQVLPAAERILRDALIHLPSGYAEPGAAEAELARCLADPGWQGFAACKRGELLGWIGATPGYSHAWELHPLVVDPSRQRRGIGSALLSCLEAQVRSQGVLTLYLGSDDDYGGTNLFGRDLYPDILQAAANIVISSKGHAMSFYRQHGFQVAGLIPDANGKGCPDILLVKRLG